MATEYESTVPAPGQELDDPEHVAAVAEVAQQRQAILQEIKKVIVGQDKVIEELLIALLARGHCLLVGVPGLAKTLLISTLANVLHLSFNRIQFTPDLMPSDITGTDILEEDRVTAGGRTYNLDLPFFVLATQNPIEQEGTYPLPEAQLDRFMFHIGIDYPSFDEEIDVVQNSTSAYTPQLQRVLSAAKILHLQTLVRQVPATRSVVGYAVRLSQGSRPNHPEAPSFIKEWVNWGAGPRASQYLVLGAKARAIMH